MPMIGFAFPCVLVDRLSARLAIAAWLSVPLFFFRCFVFVFPPVRTLSTVEIYSSSLQSELSSTRQSTIHTLEAHLKIQR